MVNNSAVYGGGAYLGQAGSGAKFTNVTIADNTGTYGGGLRVTKVRADSPAAQEGVVRGDILVGMHKWETANLENLEFVLRSSEVQQGTRVKFYILRDGRTWYGWFDLTSDTQ